MSKGIKFCIALGVVLVTWIAWGWVNIRAIQEPPYTVLQERDGYEIRQYESYLVAQVSIAAPWSQAIKDGFHALSEYSAGDNTTQASIQVNVSTDIVSKPESQAIAEAGPVISEMKNDQWLISFVLPDTYSLYTIPRPNNPRIRLLEVPAYKAAALTFSGQVDQEKSQAQQTLLADLLKRDQERIVSSFRLVQYTVPLAPSFVRRNEISVTIH